MTLRHSYKVFHESTLTTSYQTHWRSKTQITDFFTAFVSCSLVQPFYLARRAQNTAFRCRRLFLPRLTFDMKTPTPETCAWRLFDRSRQFQKYDYTWLGMALHYSRLQISFAEGSCIWCPLFFIQDPLKLCSWERYSTWCLIDGIHHRKWRLTGPILMLPKVFKKLCPLWLGLPLLAERWMRIFEKRL